MMKRTLMMKRSSKISYISIKRKITPKKAKEAKETKKANEAEEKK